MSESSQSSERSFLGIAKRFWELYLRILTAGALTVLFIGSLATVLVILSGSGAVWFTILAGLSFVIHFSALFLRDLMRENYDPDQTTFSSATEQLAVFVVVGVFLNTTLIVSTVLGNLIVNAGYGTLAAGAVVAYYPVIDLLMNRQGWLTPSRVTAAGSALILATTFNIHRSLRDGIPVINRKKRPQS